MQMLKSGFAMFFRFKFDSLGSKILKFLEFNLDIWLARAQNVYPVTHCDVD